MSRLLKTICLLLALVIGSSAALRSEAQAADKKTFKIGWSIYIGFMPLAWMQQTGVLKKWADKYGIDIQLVLVNDYVGSVNQFIGGDLDAVGIAGMDALTMPAAGGVDTSIFLITDYSNGNDVLLSKKAKTVPELKGEQVYMVQYSVSHYLVNRALTMNNMAVTDVKPVNISDAEISAAFISQPDVVNVASWKPMTVDMLKSVPGSAAIFDSSKIPGEIMDTFVAKTETMKEHPELAKAFVGAWYEAMALYKAQDAATDKMKDLMASAMGTDRPGLQGQLDTTFFFETPDAAEKFLSAKSSNEIWDKVRTFCFEQGLFGQAATSVDDIGIALPDGTVLGSKGNIKLRVDTGPTMLAEQGKL